MNSTNTTAIFRGRPQEPRLLGMVIIGAFYLILTIIALCSGDAEAQGIEAAKPAEITIEQLKRAAELMSAEEDAAWVVRAALEIEVSDRTLSAEERVCLLLIQAKAWKVRGEAKVSRHYRRMALTVTSPIRVKKALLRLLQEDQEEDLEALGLAGYRARKLLEARVLSRAKTIRRLKIETGGRDPVEDHQIMTSLTWGAEGKKLFSILFKREELEARRLADAMEF